MEPIGGGEERNNNLRNLVAWSHAIQTNCTHAHEFVY